MQNSTMRSIRGIKLKDQNSLKIIKEKLPKIKHCDETIHEMKWGWVGHITQLPPDRRAHQETFWFLGHKKRLIGKPKSRRRDEVDQFLKHKKFQRIAKNWGRRTG